MAAFELKTNNFEKTWIQINAETIIDQWSVHRYSSASYTITVEYDSNQKEILQVIVIARPNSASFSVSNRAYITDKIVNVTTSIDYNTLSLKLTPRSSSYIGCKIWFTVDYANTTTPLLSPAETTPVNKEMSMSSNGLNPTAIITSTYSAQPSELIRVNSTNGAFSIYFPLSPADGTIIGVVDVNNSFGDHFITLLPGNGNTIHLDSSFILNMSNIYVSFIYNSSTLDWKLLESPIVQTLGTTIGLVATAIKSSNVTANPNDLIRANTIYGSFSVTFPTSPPDGTIVGVADVGNSFGLFPITLLPGTNNKIENDSVSLILNVNGTYASFIYVSQLSNWKLLNIKYLYNI